MVETIQFDVGGRIFKVSRALIDAHPDTMLAKMISEAWENENNNDKPLFIDRDGFIFRHVLNYLRYGSIDLPPTIPETMFQRELDYYGIAVADETVKHNSFLDFMKSNKAELKRHQLIDDMLSLTAECHHQFSRNRNDNDEVCFYLHENDPLYEKYGYDTSTELYCTTYELVNKYLNNFFGLSLGFCVKNSKIQYTVTCEND